MKKLLLPLFACCSLWAQADNAPLWLRYPALSPDGREIAFAYKGDIYTVPAEGGRAVQLTTNPKHDTHPVWSPDGRYIAFASDREGSFDVYLVAREGGAPRRLTTHSGNEYPETFKDDTTVLFTASIRPDVKDSQFPSSLFPQIYAVSTDGGRPVLFSSLAMQKLSFSKDGSRLLYQDQKGYEDPWRKHHQSSITKDIWLCTLDGERSYQKITNFAGEDREPVWAPDGHSFYYLSEESGSFNVWKAAVSGSEKRQLTYHSTHPVRSLTVSADGLLCYTYDGELYTLREGEKPRKVAVSIVSDRLERDVVNQLLRGGATDIAVSPGGKEVAFIVHGDVYVTSMEYETTRRITDTPQQERNLSFSPDGRSLVYSAERDGVWGIYMARLTDKEEKLFTYAVGVEEEPLVVSGRTSFQPTFSPDGKEVAFLESRTTLCVINLKSRKVRTVLDGKYNYSYSDGDQTYQWSPDSRWFLAKYISVGGWNNTDIVLVKADGSGEMTNLTESGYSDNNPKWVLGGKAMIWSSDRAGYRSHGSWGAEDDMYIMFFDAEAYDKFNLSKEEFALMEEVEKEEKEAKEKAEKEEKDKKKDKKKVKDEKKDEEVEPLVFDLENRKDRVKRLTINSSHMGDAVLTPKGDKLYYCAAFEGGYDLWERNFRDNSTKLLIKNVGGGSMSIDKDGKYIYLLSGGTIKKVTVSESKVDNVSFAADFRYRMAEERVYIFEHVWRQVKDKFYDPDLHGVDWDGYRKAYERYLPHINNNYDFQEMLSELLGELNGSHTGARYSAQMSAPTVAELGVFFDEQYQGDGLKVAEVLKQGPLSKAGCRVKAGCLIEQIDGQPVKAGEDYFPLLAGKVGKRVMLSVYDPATGKRFDEQVKPVSPGTVSSLLYKRWVEQRREMVDHLSGGRVGYVHVKSMDSQSFREVYSELLGRCRNKEAVIVDVRHNGGGWLHEDLAVLLSGKEYQRFEPRGQYIGSDPFNRWLKPSCVLMCENNYSNAHGFPVVYKTLGLGKLIGAPVPGTMTAVWWERQLDSSLVFGIPQVGVKDENGRYLENHQLQPDIEVYNSPESQLRGEDTQLERAVEEMLKQLDKQ